ncbi:MAG: hypothetical protein ABFC80_08095 [Coriobacteriales bacterium]
MKEYCFGGVFAAKGANVLYVDGHRASEAEERELLAELAALREERRERPMSEKPEQGIVVLLNDGNGYYEDVLWNGNHWVDTDGNIRDDGEGWLPMPTPKGGE